MTLSESLGHEHYGSNGNPLVSDWTKKLFNAFPYLFENNKVASRNFHFARPDLLNR